jgi:hypothetical protein
METVTVSEQSKPLSPPDLMERRFNGMQAIRLEFVSRLMRLDIQIITLSIYWEDGRNFMDVPVVQNVQRKLVCATLPRVSGKFDDMVLLGYTYDPDAKAKADAELDRMVELIRDFSHQ